MNVDERHSGSYLNIQNKISEGLENPSKESQSGFSFIVDNTKGKTCVETLRPLDDHAVLKKTLKRMGESERNAMENLLHKNKVLWQAFFFSLFYFSFFF